jgi:hypothetical protein
MHVQSIPGLPGVAEEVAGDVNNEIRSINRPSRCQIRLKIIAQKRNMKREEWV